VHRQTELFSAGLHVIVDKHPVAAIEYNKLTLAGTCFVLFEPENFITSSLSCPAIFSFFKFFTITQNHRNKYVAASI